MIAPLVIFALPAVWLLVGWLWHTNRVSTRTTVVIVVASVPVALTLFALAAGTSWPIVLAVVLLSGAPALLLYRPFLVFFGNR